MDVVSGLQALGYSEYEARVYTSLVGRPGATGYELARASGVPRAKVYEVVSALERKGAVLSVIEDGRQLHRAVPPEALLARHEAEARQLLGTLSAGFRGLGARAPDYAIATITGQEPVMARVRDLCRLARAKLLCSGLPEDLIAIAADLAAAEARGVEVHVLCYGQVSLPVASVYFHSITPLQYLQVAALGRWLLVIADSDEGLLAQVTGPSATIGLWTTNPGLLMALSSWVTHDITLSEYYRQFGDVALEQLPRDLLGRLQRLWAYREGELPDPTPATEWPSVTELIDGFPARVRANPALASFTGSYQFELDGDLYHLEVAPGVCRAGPGPARDPGLTVRMRAGDFRALAMGRMALSTLQTLNRAHVEGRLDLAAKLPELLR